jgi:5-(hydroxymethyl)furfural/furfural oxidase
MVPDVRESWDYVVVGGGLAGAVVAARLSEDPAARVLLLEAGPDYRSAETPVEFLDRNLGVGLSPRPANPQSPDFYWTGITARRNSHQEVLPYRRGRGLGGSSTVNGLVAIRGVPEDFERWVELGAEGWSYQDLLWGFTRLEDDADYGALPYHGRGGPVPVYREPEPGWGGADRALQEAGADLGHPWMDDSNAPDTTGVGRLAMNIREGRRVSTNDAYLEPARGRANLRIAGDCQVDRVLFDGSRATGVRLVGGESHALAPGGEVILCAGAVHSPAILLRSGIGPAEALERLGARVLADLPVGVGAQDHAVVRLEMPVARSVMECAGNRPTNVILRYSSGIEGGGRNDVAIMATNHNLWFGVPTGGVAINLNQPHSRGRLVLRSLDPRVDPHLELHLLEDERDRHRMEDALGRGRELLAHPAFQEIALGPAVGPTTPEEVLRTVTDVMHVCSTARMGPPGDPAAVVDPDCRVLGVEGLRTVDASVMPEIVRGNIHLTVIALAELAAGRMRGQVARPGGSRAASR